MFNHADLRQPVALAEIIHRLQGRIRVMLMGVLKLTGGSNAVIANSWDDGRCIWLGYDCQSYTNQCAQ
jgi:hypothetical protein